MKKNWRLLLCFALILIPLWGSLVPILGHVYSPDSYAYQLIGRSIFSGQGFSTISMRDLNWTNQLPMPSRSFPPEWPAIVGFADWISGQGVIAASAVNLGIVALSVLASFFLVQSLGGIVPALAFGLYPLFLLSNVEFRYEVAAGRLIPLTLIFLILLLRTLVWQIQAEKNRKWMAEVCLGGIFAALFLSRFDQLFFSVWFLGSFYLIQRWSERSPRESLISTLRIGATFALLFAPWALRNYLVFGLPLATDNTFTVTSLFEGINPTSYWASGHPPRLSDNPVLWLLQRANYLRINCWTLFTMSYGICLIAPIVAFLRWSQLSLQARAVIWMALGSILTQIAMVSLTPYHFETRYFSAPHYLSFFILLIAGLNWIQSLSAVTLKKFNWAAVFALLVMVVSSGSLKGFGRHIGHNFQGIVPNGLGGLETKYRHILNRLDEHQFNKKSGVVALAKAEEFSYFTGVHSIQLPANPDHFDENFEAWLKRFRPDFILADPQWLQAMKLEAWSIETTADGLDILRVPFHEIDPQRVD